MDARAVALRLDGPAEIVELPVEHAGRPRRRRARGRSGSSADGERGPRGRGARDGGRRVLDAHVPDRAGRAGAVGRGPPRRALVPDGRGRQEGRLPGRPRARRRDDAVARALERPRAARGTGARRAAVAVADDGVAARAAGEAHAARCGCRRTWRRARSRGRSASWRRQGCALRAAAAGRRRERRRRSAARTSTSRATRATRRRSSCKRTIVFDQSAIAVDDYPKWRAWVQRVDALMHKASASCPRPDRARHADERRSRDDSARLSARARLRGLRGWPSRCGGAVAAARRPRGRAARELCRTSSPRRSAWTRRAIRTAAVRRVPRRRARRRAGRRRPLAGRGARGVARRARRRASMPSLGDAARDAALACRTADGASHRDGARARGERRARALRARAHRARARRASRAPRRRGRGRASSARRAAARAKRSSSGRRPGRRDRRRRAGPARPRRTRASRRRTRRGGAFGTAGAPATVAARAGMRDRRSRRRAGGRACATWWSTSTCRSAQTVGLVLRAHGAAVAARRRDAVVARRPFELGRRRGARASRRWPRPAGTLRLVARVGTAKEDDAVEIDAFGEDGAPLARARAGGRLGGDVARVTARRPRSTPAPPPATATRTLLAAAARPGRGRAPRGRAACSGASPTRPDARARAGARLRARRRERARSVGRDARRARAQRLRARARGVARELGGDHRPRGARGRAARARGGGDRDRCAISTALRVEVGRPRRPLARRLRGGHRGREHLFDRARAALERARADARGHGAPRRRGGRGRAARRRRAGRGRVRPGAPDRPRHARRASTPCAAPGDRAGADARARAPARASSAARDGSWPSSCATPLAAGDDATAGRAFAAMRPAERTLTALGAAPGRSVRPGRRRYARAPPADGADGPRRPGGDRAAPARRGRATRPAISTRPPSGSPPTTARAPILPNAATAVLAHTERYEITPDGPRCTGCSSTCGG